MNFGERTRGLGSALRLVAVGGAVVGIYYGVNTFSGSDHSGSGVQSSLIEEPKKDYFDHFTMGDIEIELTGVQHTPGLAGTENILISGRAMKDPTTELSSGGWKFDLQSGENIFPATLTILSRNADSVDVGFAAIVPSSVDRLTLNIIHSVATGANTENGSVGSDAIRSIPLPSLDTQETSPNRT